MALQRLIDTMTLIERHKKYGIDGARALPGRYASDVSRLDGLNAPYSFPEAERQRLNLLGKEALSLVKAKERLRGEIERDEELRKIAANLEAFRRELPNLAAQAAIELGALARDLVKEAEG
jgi:hypothetical protein